MRENYEEELIELYQKALSETLKKLKYGSKIPSLSDVKKEIKDFLFYGKNRAILALFAYQGKIFKIQ